MIRDVDDAFVIRALELTELAFKTRDRCLAADDPGAMQTEPMARLRASLRRKLFNDLGEASEFMLGPMRMRDGESVSTYVASIKFRGQPETEMVRELILATYTAVGHVLGAIIPQQDERAIFDRLERVWVMLDSTVRLNKPAADRELTLQTRVRQDADLVRQALEKLGATSEETSASQGKVRQETGLSHRRYRTAVALLKSDSIAQSKPGPDGGAWLIPAIRN